MDIINSNPHLKEFSDRADDIARRIQVLRNKITGLSKTSESIRNSMRKAGFKFKNKEDDFKSAKEIADELATEITQLIADIAKFRNNILHTKPATPDEEYNKQLVINALDSINARVTGPLNHAVTSTLSKLLSIKKKYDSIIKNINRVKKIASFAKNAGKYASYAGKAASVLLNPVFWGVLLVIVLIFGIVIIVYSVKQTVDDPSASFQAVIEAGCINISDPDCATNLIMNSVQIQMNRGSEE